MIEELINNLPKHEKAQLFYALNEEFAHHVMIDDKHFLGVHMPEVGYTILESAGVWSYGHVS